MFALYFLNTSNRGPAGWPERINQIGSAGRRFTCMGPERV
jgi:hypothetical protein